MDLPLPSAVPAWALDNQKRFLSIPSRSDSAIPSLPAWALDNQKRSNEGSENRATSIIRASFPEPVTRAVAMGLITTATSSASLPPSLSPPASYFRDVKNHPDVLATIINTARVTAGWNPGSGQGDGEEHEAFKRFIAELDRYIAYLVFTGAASQQINSAELDCNGILFAVSTVIENALHGGETSEGITEKIEDMLKAATEYVTSGLSTNAIADTSCSMVALPAVTGQIYRDPSTTIGLSVVALSHDVSSGKSKVISENFPVTTYNFRLMSSAIVAYADHLAGSHITSAEQLVRILNTRTPEQVHEIPN